MLICCGQLGVVKFRKPVWRMLKNFPPELISQWDGLYNDPCGACKVSIIISHAYMFAVLRCSQLDAKDHGTVETRRHPLLNRQQNRHGTNRRSQPGATASRNHRLGRAWWHPRLGVCRHLSSVLSEPLLQRFLLQFSIQYGKFDQSVWLARPNHQWPAVVWFSHSQSRAKWTDDDEQLEKKSHENQAHQKEHPEKWRDQAQEEREREKAR